MGLIGRYIDGLPPHARDRLIQAQDWCVASVRGPDGSRCLVGHAEDWEELAADAGWWGRWVDGSRNEGCPRAQGEVETLCRPELFAFRRARPADLRIYRDRVRRWGAESECRIGARFDRLCARRGLSGAIRAVKRRAGRDFAVSPAAARTTRQALAEAGA